MANRAVDWVKDGNVAIMTLDNPPVNQYGFSAMDDTQACLNEIRRDADVKVVVYTAAGDKTFCGGADLKLVEKYFQNYPGANVEMAIRGGMPQDDIASFPKPVIAALNGHTLGGGLELAMACDLRVASPNIKLGLSEVKLGMMPGGGGTQRLPRLVGYGRAMYMMLTGKTIDAYEAERIGLVNLVAPSREELMNTTMELARKIASYSSDSLYHIKQCAYFGGMADLREGLDYEHIHFGEIYKSLGAREGVRSFFEKRKPDYTNM